jgi:hypothetical protein
MLLLAKGWEEKCLEFGVIQRQRGIKNLVTADRAYGTINGIEHCVKNKSDFI